MEDQLLTIAAKAALSQASELEQKASHVDDLSSASPTIVDKQNQQTQCLGKRVSKRKTKKRGGWGLSRYLTWDDVKAIDHADHVLSRNKVRPNIFVSINPQSDVRADGQRKRQCHLISSRIGQKIKRAGFSFLGIKVFEKPPHGGLHLHMLLYVPPEIMPKILNMADGHIVHMCLRAKHHRSYITKNRRKFSPKIEENIAHRQTKGAAFVGKRWSLTKDAQTFLAFAN